MDTDLELPSRKVLQFQETEDDPFEPQHIGDLLHLPPIESTYRTKSGVPLPEEWSSQKSMDRQDMRRLFVHDDDRVLIKIVHYGHPTSVGVEFDEEGKWQFKPIWARRAGPRAWIYFHPLAVRAAIVTCGGLCPGLNDVIRQIVFTLQVYGVNDILGVQYGFRGFIDKDLPPIPCHKRKMRMVVVCIPKTIDNDILLIERTFGFDTAVEEAQHAINAAYVEASSAYNGIGIVKLMGRQSGFIAMHATLASGQVDVVLIPEISFEMEGKHGVLHFMRTRLEKNGLCVVVIAEGAAQDFVEEEGNYDASGNPVLGDIGKWFVSQVKEYFKKLNMSIDLKYIDPTYMIRARPSNAADHILCTVLGQNAVHGAFAGYTNITVGLVNTHYCYLPIPEVIKHPRRVDPNSNMWHRCVTSTGQPDFVPPVPDVVPMEFPLSQRRANSFIQYQGQAQSSS